MRPGEHDRLEVLVRGVFDRERLLDLVRHFVVFEDETGGTHKKMAGYHQFHATPEGGRQRGDRSQPARRGDRRGGVVWHTQGSGKSLTMAFYAGTRDPPSGDGQPDAGRPHRPQRPGRPAVRHVRPVPGAAAPGAGPGGRPRGPPANCSRVASGGVVFTTIQKFLPEAKGDRHPHAVRPAEHRGDRRRGAPQPVRLHRRLRPAHADALPNASFIGFTGTPDRADRRATPARSSATTSTSTTSSGRSTDGATVPIYYESRLAKLELDEDERPKIDPEFEEVTEGEEVGAQGEAQDQVGPARGRGRRGQAARARSRRTWSSTSRRGWERHARARR